MSKLATIALLACTAVACLVPVSAHAEQAKPAQAFAAKVGRVAINGVRYYYEVRGQGEPLLLLHGGLGSIDMFGPVLPKLAEGRKVIVVDTMSRMKSWPHETAPRMERDECL